MKKLEVAPPGFEPTPQLLLAQKVRPHTGRPYISCTVCNVKLIALKYFSLPIFTLFETCGAVFIMKSKVHLRKNSLNEYFKTISHYFRVYPVSGFIYYTTAIPAVHHLIK